MPTVKAVPSIDTQRKLTKFIRYIERQVLIEGMPRGVADLVIYAAEEELEANA
jgi:hypothetical protein